jgi:hypothetical protein
MVIDELPLTGENGPLDITGDPSGASLWPLEAAKPGALF